MNNPLKIRFFSRKSLKNLKENKHFGQGLFELNQIYYIILKLNKKPKNILPNKQKRKSSEKLKIVESKKVLKKANIVQDNPRLLTKKIY